MPRLTHLLTSVFAVTLTSAFAAAQSTASDDGYTGYNLSISDTEPLDTLYSTANTNSNVSFPDPDVFLNASVSVGTIEVLVANLTAKINLDLQVLNLLEFNAGVDLSIDRVRLLIQDVKARVLLEARLENLVRMVDDVLESIDLNPIIASLGDAVGNVTEGVGDVVEGVAGGTNDTSALAKRAFELDNGILYSINDYSGNMHTNRVLAQNGELVDRKLDNQGDLQSQRAVGRYSDQMRFAGHDETVESGSATRVQEWVYEPYVGISAICAVYLDASGEVVETRVVAESFGGGSSSISEDM